MYSAQYIIIIYTYRYSDRRSMAFLIKYMYMYT